MAVTIEEFFHDFRQNILVNAESNQEFLELEFTQLLANELIDAGNIEEFSPCHYRALAGGNRVDGYSFNEDSLDLFIVDFSNHETIQSLTQTEVTQIFKRVENFFTTSAEKNLYVSLEETSPGYELARRIVEQKNNIIKVNFYLFSERVLSDRVKELNEKTYKDWKFSYNIWDISRLYRLSTSRGAREALEIDFSEMPDGGLPCLPAHLSANSYESYLAVMPANILSQLYDTHGARLLEQNVRSFLQVRGNINKGIRATILHDPEMFFAYNNGITATAKSVTTKKQQGKMLITSIKDLQIVNGGQTTASLYHTQRHDKASLDNIFVQMKLSVVDDEKSEEVVPKISEYANTQNKVNAADFFANHPFHVRMQEFSRRLWVPAPQGALRETKWFYERARGQYLDAQNKLTPAKRKIFLAEYPKIQMFTKPDLAKFENVWDDKPNLVNLGAQKNFAQYAMRIGSLWDTNPSQFNELYYKRIIARAILFKKTEKLIPLQSWYTPGYRANIVAYTIGMLGQICNEYGKEFDFNKVWILQDITPATTRAIEIIAKVVYKIIMHPQGNFTHVGEWCKKDLCWIQMKSTSTRLIEGLPQKFFNELISKEDSRDAKIDAMKTQKILTGIEAQTIIYNTPTEKWHIILSEGKKAGIYSPKEIGLLELAAQIPNKFPSDKQALLLLQILDRAKKEAIYAD